MSRDFNRHVSRVTLHSLFTFKLVDNLGHLLGGDGAEYFAVNGNHRSKAAAADAANGFNRKFTVFGYGVEADAEDALALVDQVLSAFQVAGRTHADRDLVAGRAS